MASVGAEPQVVLQYLEECPRWWLAYARLLTAMRRAGLAHVEPTVHRVESIEEGLRIHAALAERVSGVALPRYVIDPPDGSGKIDVRSVVDSTGAVS